VEALHRPWHAGLAPAGQVSYAEDDAATDRVSALGWLALSRNGRRQLLATLAGGPSAVWALAGDGAVARRVAARGAVELGVLDADPDAEALCRRVAYLLDLPRVHAGARSPARVA
jgi:hypothetical protein